MEREGNMNYLCLVVCAVNWPMPFNSLPVMSTAMRSVGMAKRVYEKISSFLSFYGGFLSFIPFDIFLSTFLFVLER